MRSILALMLTRLSYAFVAAFLMLVLLCWWVIFAHAGDFPQPGPRPYYCDDTGRCLVHGQWTNPKLCPNGTSVAPLWPKCAAGEAQEQCSLIRASGDGRAMIQGWSLYAHQGIQFDNDLLCCIDALFPGYIYWVDYSPCLPPS